MKCFYKIKLYFVIILTLGTLKMSAQSEIRLYYGLAESVLLESTSLDGGAVYNNSSASEIGIRYLHTISDRIRIESGINRFSCKVEVVPAFTGIPVRSRDEEFKLYSIPIYVNYLLTSRLFINAGPILDIQNGSNSFDSQSGIGYGLGFGGIINLGKTLLYINPIFKRHAVLAFDKEQYQQKLTQWGLQIGFAYDF